MLNSGDDSDSGVLAAHTEVGLGHAVSQDDKTPDRYGHRSSRANPDAKGEQISICGLRTANSGELTGDDIV